MKMIPAVCAVALALFDVACAGRYTRSGRSLRPAADTGRNRWTRVVSRSSRCFRTAVRTASSSSPTIEAWRARQAADVQFRRLPAVFRTEWVILAQAFYAAEALGVTNKVNRPIFEAIHLKGLNPAHDPTVLAGVFKEAAGVDGEEFLKVLNSFGVRSKVQQADAQGRMYRLRRRPDADRRGQIHRLRSESAGQLRPAVGRRLSGREGTRRTQPGPRITWPLTA